MRSVVEERDEDRDDVRTDWLEPHMLLLTQKRQQERAQRSSSGFVQRSVFCEVLLSLCKEAVVSHCRT